MSIDQFTRDAAYFQSRRDSGMLLNAEDLDFQFNNLIDYLNTKIVPIINDFVQGQFIGVNNPVLANACLLNIGDGNVRWEKINSNIFPDYSIPLSKFASVSPNCIVWAGNNGIFGYNTVSNLNDGILFSRNNITPVWRKVATGDIENGSITREKIDVQSVKFEHLSQELQNVLQRGPRVILNTSIINSSIREDNLQNNSITSNKISLYLRTLRQQSITQGNYEWLNTSLENRHFADQLFIGGYGLDSIPISASVSKYRHLQIRSNFYADDDQYYTFHSGNIAIYSLTSDLFSPFAKRLKITNFGQGAIESKHIIKNSIILHGFFEQVNKDRIPKEALDPIIRAKLGV